MGVPSGPYHSGCACTNRVFSTKRNGRTPIGVVQIRQFMASTRSFMTSHTSTRPKGQ